MTRKDFELIAETIRFAPVDVLTRLRIADDFADALKRTNPRFDMERFMSAATKPTRGDETAADLAADRGAV